ncbi:MAG: efflux RND transporter periplasmic adaptor subunit, partial [Planctomycetota bacterium]
MNTRAWNLTLSVLAAPALALLVWGCGMGSSTGGVRADLATVERGNLSITVTESANLRAARETRVKCQMEGKSTVIWLVPEGASVDKGDKLVELDASNQIERRAQQEIAVEKAEAAVVNAEKNLDILKKQIDADLKAAENNLTFAKMDEEKFYGKVLPDGTREMGEKEQSLEAEREQIKLAEARLKLAEDKLEASIRLRKQDFITENELEEAQLDHDSKKSALVLARNRLDLLRDYTHKKTEMELEQKVTDAKLEQEREVARCEAKLVQAVAELKSKKAERELATERFENLKTQIENSIVRAPTPGIVVYAYEGDWRRRQYIEEGATVRERQNLVILPDTTKMVAEMRVHEAMASKVKPGQRALIEVDTLEKPLPGTVTRRSPLPDSGSRWGNPDLKVYKTEVAIDGNNANMALRPGMSATGKILIAELRDVLQIPLQAVNRERAVNYVWLKTKSGPVARPITVGDGNSTHVVVESGLEEGQQVYLAKPPGAQTPELPQPERAAAEQLEAAAQPTSDANGDGALDAGEGNTRRGEQDEQDNNPNNANQGNAERGNRADRGNRGRGGFDMSEMAKRMAANPSF